MERIRGFFQLSCLGQGKRKVLTIIGGLIIHSCMSLILVWGTIQPYFLSYFRSFDTSITMAKASMIVPGACFTLGLTNLIALKLATRCGIKKTTLISMMIFSIAAMSMC